MQEVQNNNEVKVHYKGTLADGTVFDSSEGREPLSFTVGGGNMIPGFEKAVLGMKLEESKTVQIPCEEAYGQKRDDLIQEINKSLLPEGMQPEIGQKLQSQDQTGRSFVVTVTGIQESTITIDGNHELAGKDLTFEIKLVGIA